MNKALNDVLEDMRNGVVPAHDSDEDLVKIYGEAVGRALSDDFDPVETDFDALLVGLKALCQCYIESTEHGEYHSDMDPHIVLRFIGMLAKAHESEIREAAIASANVPKVCIGGPANGKAMLRALDIISRSIKYDGEYSYTLKLSLHDVKKLCDDAMNEPARPVDMYDDWQPVWEYWVRNVATSDDDKHCNEPFLKWMFHKKEAGNAGENN